MSKLTKPTIPQRNLLWKIAQHKYGWANVSPYGGERGIADALVRAGLVKWGVGGRNGDHPFILLTKSGRAEIEERWPISPYVLQTYEPQPGGWTPPDGIRKARRV